MLEAELTDAFPALMRTDVRAALDALSAATLRANYTGQQPLMFQGEPLRIPSRIYHPEPEPQALQTLTPQQQTVLSCLLSRHHDGHVRMRQGTAAMRSGAHFALPFVALMAGDYVVQVVERVRTGLADLNDCSSPTTRAYGRFFAENPEALVLLRQRTASFWNAHYRRSIPRDRYPGFAIVAAFEQAARCDAHQPPQGRDLADRTNFE